MDTTTAGHLGHKVRQAREAQNLTQSELAALAGLGQPTVSTLERTGTGRAKTVLAVARVLGLDAEQLLRDQFSERCELALRGVGNVA